MSQNLFVLEHKILKELQSLWDTPSRHNDGTILQILPTAIKAYSRLLKESERIVVQNDKMMKAQRKRLAKEKTSDDSAIGKIYDDVEIENIAKNDQARIKPRAIMAIYLPHFQYSCKDLDWSLWKELFNEFMKIIKPSIHDSGGVIHNILGNYIYVYWNETKEEKILEIIRVAKQILNACVLLSKRHKESFALDLFLAKIAITCDCFRVTTIDNSDDARKFFSIFGERWHILTSICDATKDYEFSFDQVFHNFMPEDIDLKSIGKVNYLGEETEIYNYYV